MIRAPTKASHVGPGASEFVGPARNPEIERRALIRSDPEEFAAWSQRIFVS